MMQNHCTTGRDVMSTVDELAVLARNGDPAAYLNLWKGVKGFAISQSKRWIGSGAEKEDLQQAGFMALYPAVARFDPVSGSFLGLYANCLKSAFRCAVFGGRSEKTMNDPLRSCLSLDAFIDDDEDGGSFVEIVPDEAAERDFESIEQQELSRAVRNALCVLEAAERDVIILRFWGGLRQDQAAQKLRISAADAKKIEQAALRKLRHPSVSQILKSFL